MGLYFDWVGSGISEFLELWMGVLGGLEFYLMMGCSGVMVVDYVDDGSG
jgi:hypothetical protein